MTSKYSVELFMEACNAAGPLHLSVEDANRPGPIRRIFHQPFVVIGRDPTTDLLLDHRRVSRRHTYLQIVRGRLFCIDLGSRTGTTWDDNSKEAGWLDAGRSISVGPYEIGLWSEAPPTSENQVITWPSGKMNEQKEASSYTVDFLTPASRQSSLRIDHDLALVGSSAACLVRLPFSDVSKAHCSLLYSPHGVWVVDLLGRGGTFVNETHVRFARLDNGDELRIGRHILRFRSDESTPRPSPPASSPSRALARRSPDSMLTKRHERPAIPPSSSVSMVPVWHYPETEIQRALNSRQANQVELIQALMQPMVQQFGLMQQQMFEQFHLAMMGMFQTFGTAYREQMGELREELDEVRRLTKELQELQAQAASRNEADLIARAARTEAESLAQNSLPKTSTTPHATGADSEEPPFRQPLTKSDIGVHDLLFDRIASLQNERQSRWQKILAKMNMTS